MLNKVFLMGRLTRDPELRRTQSGIAVASLRLAVDRDYKSQNGERETDFIDVVAWRSTAEFVCKYFSKGRMAVVEGRLQIREYTDKEGNRRWAAEVVADNIYFGDSKKDGGGGGFGGSGGSGGGSAPSFGRTQRGSSYDVFDADDVDRFNEDDDEASDGETPF